LTLNMGWTKPSLMVCSSYAQAGSASSQLKPLLAGLPVKGNESYRLAVSSSGVLIDSPAGSGVFYGVQSLRQLLRNDQTIPWLSIADWPDQSVRACYIGLPTDPEGLVRKMARLKINHCIVESRWYAGGNWWYNPYGNNRTEAQTFMNLCRQYNIEPVPLVQGFGWGYGVVDINPNCSEGIWVQNESKTLSGTTAVAFSNPNVIRTASAPIVVTNSAKNVTYVEGIDYQIIPGTTVRPFETSNTPWKIARIATGAIASGQSVLVSYNYMEYSPAWTPYCPSEPLTYQIVDDTLNNVINIYQPNIIHIGHDEVTQVNRCSRCQQSGKTALQLIGGDITHWYNQLKSGNSSVEIMMWDDLLRSNHSGGSAISYVPTDVIICPWVYGSKTADSTEIESRMSWFLTTNQRPTLGTASGYWVQNVWLWKDAVARYSNNPNCLGFMFSWWGENPVYWSALSFAAEYMWSRERLDQTMFNWYAQADQVCRDKGLGLTLSLNDQKATIAQLVNDATAARRDARTDANALASSLNGIKRNIVAIRELSSELNFSEVSAGTVPERALTQMRALPVYYWCMGAYVQCQKYHSQGDRTTALNILTDISGNFKTWHFTGWGSADSWVSTYQSGGNLPTSQEMFGVTLNLFP